MTTQPQRGFPAKRCGRPGYHSRHMWQEKETGWMYGCDGSPAVSITEVCTACNGVGTGADGKMCRDCFGQG